MGVQVTCTYVPPWLRGHSRGSQGMGVVNKQLAWSWFTLKSLHVQTLTLTDAQAPFLGTPLVPLTPTIPHSFKHYIYIYIYIERERDVYTHVCTYIYIYIYIWELLPPEMLELIAAGSTAGGWKSSSSATSHSPKSIRLTTL